VPRVELDGEIRGRAARQAQVPAHALDYGRELRRCEEVRRTAAEMELRHLAIGSEQRQGEVDLGEKPLDVTLALGRIPRDQPVASAIEAGAEAPRHVHVDRHRPRRRLRVRLRREPPEIALAPGLGELRCRRVRRVARTGAVIARDERGIEKRGDVHDHTVPGRTGGALTPVKGNVLRLQGVVSSFNVATFWRTETGHAGSVPSAQGRELARAAPDAGRRRLYLLHLAGALVGYRRLRRHR